jgi:hypothetical protein
MSGGQATSVTYADSGEAAASFQHSRLCALPVPDVVARLRDAIIQVPNK